MQSSLNWIQIKWFWHLSQLKRSLASECLIFAKSNLSCNYSCQMTILASSPRSEIKKKKLKIQRLSHWLLNKNVLVSNLLDFGFIVYFGCFKSRITSGPFSCDHTPHFLASLTFCFGLKVFISCRESCLLKNIYALMGKETSWN